MAPPDTRALLRELREELKALDMAIATFERLAALRRQAGESADPPSRRPTAKRRTRPGEATNNSPRR